MPLWYAEVYQGGELQFSSGGYVSEVDALNWRDFFLANNEGKGYEVKVVSDEEGI